MTHIEALTKYIEATNTHDFENVKQILHPNAVYWFSDQTCTSISEIQNYFETSWNTIKEEVYTASDVQWLGVDHTTATCIYKYHYEGYYLGNFVSGSGRATNVFIKDIDQKWKLVHEHLSSMPKPPQ